MSDTYYRQLAIQRRKRYILISAILISIACISISLMSVFRDNCTGSFDRDPETVVLSFIDAIQTGNQAAPRRCWQDAPYFDIESGCSEICIQRIMGTSYRLDELELQEPVSTEDGRAQITAEVVIACPDNEEQFQGEIVLDSIAQDVPWRHWKIIYSTFGGPLSDPWCK